jgi:general secretion pathway protein E
MAVLAQRLVRLICKECRRAGCAACNNSGYRGRQGIFEMMEMTDEIRALVMRNADATEITAAARRHGMRTMKEDARAKVEAGVTTEEEVLRVTQAI